VKVAVLDDYQGVALGSAGWRAVTARAELVVFSDHVADEGELAERLQDFEVVVLMRERTPFPRSLFERLPKLRLLVTTGTRNASVDAEAASDAGVVFCGTAGLPYPTAELTWGLILALVRRIPMEDREMRRGNWQTTMGEGLQGKTLGVIGLGRLGSQVASVGRVFGMSVVAWSENLTRERAEAAGVELAGSKAELLGRSDVVTIHLVLSDRTRGLIGVAELGLMWETSYLVNTSRGPIVDEWALVEALRSRSIAGAGIDVFETEPVPVGHPLLELSNVVLTPHLGYVTKETYEVFYGEAMEDIVAFLDGSPVRVIEGAS
jgi:phosphoglycerate dehydrogenase-like enzyme